MLVDMDVGTLPFELHYICVNIIIIISHTHLIENRTPLTQSCSGLELTCRSVAHWGLNYIDTSFIPFDLGL